MTVTLTYKNGFLDDCDSTTGWTETESGLVASLACDGDVLTITGTCDNVADEYAYYEKDITDIARANYPYLTVRFKTSAASDGLAAHVRVVTTGAGAGTQDIPLGFSTTWKVTTTALTGGVTIDKIQIMANDSPDTIATGTFYVYFDWIIIHAGTFPFPHVAPGGVQVNLPVKIAQLQIPGRNGDILQHLGMASFEITVRGDVLEGETWRSGTTDPHFSYFLVGLIYDTWAYFACDRPLIRCQVMYKGLTYEPTGENMKLQWVLHFIGFKLGDYDSFLDLDWIWGTA